MRRILALLSLLGLLAGCGLLPDQIDETKGWSASKLFTEAKEKMADADYARAIELFEKLEARYPYGAYAQQAQLEVAYAYYLDNEPASAIAACDRFIKLHPNHPHVDYVYYLKGLANFVENQDFLSQLSEQDMSERDPKAAKDAFAAFKELSTRFPESKYTPDAVARMAYLVNSLASHEVKVANYYFKRGAYVAAVNRSKHVLENYKTSPFQEGALAIMVKSYERMGMNDLRDDARRVLDKNFPNSPWLTGDGPKKNKSWWQFWSIDSLN
ncbi:MAG: outer membrane protein assembly factor BamD [Betaproteobacteria bacterium]|nr:outer membrane protein assembly factor BamD [Betaproteobacteria bacterium]